jgi:hypothetical protein
MNTKIALAIVTIAFAANFIVASSSEKAFADENTILQASDCKDSALCLNFAQFQSNQCVGPATLCNNEATIGLGEIP